MLGKLIKYEISATGRLFLPFYGALILFALINKIFFSFKMPVPDFIAEITLSIYAIIIVAIVVLTFLVMIQRFYKNLLTDEGYLMFTLPVQSWQHVLSKLIVSILWILLSGIVTLFTIFLMVFNSQMIPQIYEFFIAFFRYVSPSDQTAFFVFLLKVGFTALFSSICSILMIYTSIAVGQLFGKHRILASFGAFLGISFIMQSATSLFAVFFMRPIIERIDHMEGTFIEFSNTLGTLFQFSNIINIVLSILFFSLTSYILQKKLNLE